jgi:hypothetical protein
MTVQLTTDELREDVTFALVDEGHLPKDARAAVNLCHEATSFSDLYREALTKIRSTTLSDKKPESNSGNSVRKGGRGESPEPRAAVPSRAVARVKASAPQAPEITSGEEKTMDSKHCKCGCGAALSAAQLSRGWEYMRGHKPASGESTAPKKSAAAKKSAAKKVTAKKAPATGEQHPGGDRDLPQLATLCFSSEQLDRMFLTLSLELKAECLQTWLGRTAQ